MSSNKLNLLVQFTGIDKLSGGLKNIVGASKASTQSLRTMRAEVKENQKELKRVQDLLKGGSTNSGLVLAEQALGRAIADTNGKIDAQKRKLENVANIQKRFSGIAATAGKVGTVATATVTAPLVAFGVAAVKAASDAEELKSAFYVTFGDKGAEMETWANSTGKHLQRSGRALMAGANSFGTFFNLADPKKAAGMSKQFAVLAQDLSSFYNVDPGDALQSLMSGLSGESEPLRKFGVFMTDAAVKAQAMKMGLSPINGELTEQQKIMARAGLIMANTSKAQGDLVRTGGGFANKARATSDAWGDLMVVVGRDLIPAILPALETFTSLIQSFSSLGPETRKWIILIAAGAAAFGPIIAAVAGVATAIGTLAPLLAGSGAAVAMFAGVWLPLIAIVAYAAYQIYTHWDEIVAFVSSGWDTIKGWFNSGVAAVKTALGGLPGWLTGIGKAMMDGLLLAINPLALANKLLMVAKTGIAAFKNYLGIKSPSRLMMQMGDHMNAGLRLGLDQGRGQPVRAMGRMAGAVAGAGAMALSPAAARPAAAATQQAVSKVEIHVHQQPGEDANALAERVARLVEQAQRGKALRSFGDD